MTIEATYTVSGMTCGHCERAVREEVGQLPGVRGVEVSHETGAMTVISEAPVDLGDVAAAVDEAGDYTVAPA